MEIEAKGAAAILPIMLSIDAITRYKEEAHENLDTIDDDSLILPDEVSCMTAYKLLVVTLYNTTLKELKGSLSDLRIVKYVTIQLQRISKAIKVIFLSHMYLTILTVLFILWQIFRTYV